ncbi:TonB-dependent receptor [Acinetobacter chengduensis]|uniref:TonB-dependent receptor n=2 Tax=Moraxellaceae TaxID=468 RepID=A0ABX9TY21_9GAMM|nr:TonB-dependent receptor [Acinetobacter sp. WCHAc060007]RLL22778.1 TonB-dependent receptor [Acinetobacter chengduensis]
MRFCHSPLYIAMFTALPSAQIFAAETSPSPIEIQMNTIVVEADQHKEVGTAKYNQEQLKDMPNGKKSISDFLKTHTNVQFDRDAYSSGNQASLAPEKISINGAPNFANKFTVNGVNTSNTFDPVGESADSNYYGAPSNSQTANINTDLICELEVIDSNASAEHGDFQGGVITAKTCAPKSEIGKLHGSISYDYTNSDWSRFNYVDDAEEADFEDQDTDHHKEYTTQGISANVYGRLNEEWSFNAFGATRGSRIPVMSGLAENDKIKTEEINNNAGFTAYFNPNDQQAYQFGIEHYEYDKEGYYKNKINSDYTIDTITDTLFFNAKNKFNGFQLEQNLNYRTTELDRRLKSNTSTIWNYAAGSKDWLPNSKDGDTLTDGGFGGNIINQQSTLSYDLKAIFDPIKLANTTHRFKTGAGYQHNEGSWERPDSMSVYTTRADLGTASCAVGDAQCDEADLQYRASSTKPWESWSGQYSRSGTFYNAGKFTARQDQWHVFAEDDISWNNFRARLGLRADYDSLASNLNIAPRSTFEYLPFSNESLKFTAGFNRYYGNVFLMTELDEKAYTTYANLSRLATYQNSWDESNNYGWVTTYPNSQAAAVRATDVKTPYSDEKVFAISSQIKNLDLNLKWVNRQFEDRIEETRIYKTTAAGTEALDYRTYSNVDGGHADTYTFSMSNINPWEIGQTQHKLGLGLSYIDNETTRGSYKDMDSDSRNAYVSLNGSIVPKSQLPVKDAPFTARLNWEMKGTALPFTLHNFLNFRSASTNYVATGDKVSWNGENISVMEEQDFSSKFTWDTRATYDWKITPQQSMTFGLTVSNLFNKHNKNATDNGKLYSEEGRRFIADVTYKF